MSFPDIIDVSSDEETDAREIKDIKPIISACVAWENTDYTVAEGQLYVEGNYVKQSIQEQINQINRSIVTSVSYDSYPVDGGISPIDGFCPASTAHNAPVPLCRHFWKSADYEDGHTRSSTSQSIIHPCYVIFLI